MTWIVSKFLYLSIMLGVRQFSGCLNLQFQNPMPWKFSQKSIFFSVGLLCVCLYNPPGVF